MEPEAYEELDQLEAVHWWYEGMRRITHAILRHHITDRHNLKILDAGCGAGGNLQALAQYGCVYGIDYSPMALKYAKKRGFVTRASVEHLPFADHQFDLITSFDVLYHRGVEDDTKGFREFARVVRPGGWVLVRLPALEALRGTHDVVVHGKRRYNTEILTKKFNEAGLLIKQITYANSLMLPFIFTVRQLEQRLTNSAANLSSDVKAPPSYINAALTMALTWEANWMGRGRSFAAGVSIFGIAQKPD